MASHVVEVGQRHVARFDAQAAQLIREQHHRAAVELGGAQHVVAGLAHGQHGRQQPGQARASGHAPAASPFEAGHLSHQLVGVGVLGA